MRRCWPVSLLPVVAAFGLAKDHEVFLVSRMPEAYVHGEAQAQAIVTGFRHGARVVTAAAVIMTAVTCGDRGRGDRALGHAARGLSAPFRCCRRWRWRWRWRWLPAGASPSSRESATGNG
ncbi:MMPL family transporter [Streptomyces sp. NPDC002911]